MSLAEEIYVAGGPTSTVVDDEFSESHHLARSAGLGARLVTEYFHNNEAATERKRAESELELVTGYHPIRADNSLSSNESLNCTWRLQCPLL